MTAMVQRFCTFCIAVLTLFATSDSAEERKIQQGSGPWLNVRVVGRLTDFEKVPIADATVGLAGFDATVWQPVTRSSATGDFELRVQLQPGDYRVIAAFGRYEVATGQCRTQAGMKPTLEVNLVAPADSAKSDQPPNTAPPVGLLPGGRFQKGEVHTAASSIKKTISSAGNQEFVNVFYVTNRPAVAGRPGQYLDGPVSKLKTSYGVCKVSIPPTHKIGQLERPSIWRFERVENIEEHIVITNRELIQGDVAFQRMLHRAFQESGSEAFIFIHGYNVAFDDAVRRTAQLFRDLRFGGVPILFSWPAQNAWWRYPAAEDAVDVSSRQLSEFLLQTLADQKLTAVNVIAHSMGNRILTAALERLTLRRANAQFNNIVMAAPDLNIADFGEVSGILRSSAARTTIYSSSRDVALLVSKSFHSYTRLGEAPPVDIAPGIDTIDASAIRQDLLGHSYFGDSATVIKDLFLLLTQGLNPSARFLQPKSLGTQQYWVLPKE